MKRVVHQARIEVTRRTRRDGESGDPRFREALSIVFGG
jgi:hypothetical protein